MNSASPTWLASAGASANVLHQIEREVQGLPESYLRCLRAGNGGEVGLRASPFNLCLDSAESALDYWRSGTYPKHGVFIFGGDGGGSLLAFDLGVAGAPVICFDPIDPEGSIETVSASFDGLLELCEVA